MSSNLASGLLWDLTLVSITSLTEPLLICKAQGFTVGRVKNKGAQLVLESSQAQRRLLGGLKAGLGPAALESRCSK